MMFLASLLGIIIGFVLLKMLIRLLIYKVRNAINDWWEHKLACKAILEQSLPIESVMYVSAIWPHLEQDALDRLSLALKNYFILCHAAKMRFIAMPSLAVDQMWHAFILCGKDYGDFCRNHLGCYLHHSPADDAPSLRQQQADSLALCWQLACRQEGLSPLNPAQLPQLFALDRQLQIPHGFDYQCRDGKLQVWRDGVRLMTLDVRPNIMSYDEAKENRLLQQRVLPAKLGGGCGGGEYMDAPEPFEMFPTGACEGGSSGGGNCGGGGGGGCGNGGC